jgi:hypothetical protein
MTNKDSDSIPDDNSPDKLAAALARLEAEKTARLMARLATPGYQAKLAWKGPNETEAEARERFRSEHGEAADLVIGWKGYPTAQDEPARDVEIPPRDYTPPSEEPPAPSPIVEAVEEGGTEGKDWAVGQFRRFPYRPSPREGGAWN